MMPKRATLIASNAYVASGGWAGATVWAIGALTASSAGAGASCERHVLQ
ncbi:MAG TPA: hypothetical protein VGP65_02070 [Candidatus Angelobacter sp.]|nr:hypothetical protein [Candidatus Angelobacter sp.]